MQRLRWVLLFAAVLLAGGTAPLPVRHANAAETPPLFQRDNLVAWCIVPFDAKKRGPQARVEMLKQLGFRKYAYDWRAEHLPTFAEEVRLLKQHGVELTAVWFPTELNADARTLLDVLEQQQVRTQLWVTGGGGPTASPEEQRQRVAAEARRIRPIAEAAARIGCQVALYNHGGWFGEPENQLEILAELKLPNVGLVYNLHHGHDHLDRFAALLAKMQPHLLSLNLNGMIPRGDQLGQKILPLGAGSLDLALLRTISRSEYRGPIGILGHTQDDAAERLQDNLDGLAWLLPQLAGQPAGPAPKYRTYNSPPPPGKVSLAPGRFGQALDPRHGGAHLAGKAEYRTPPLTLELWAKLPDRQPYNILVANELKSSATHWELFTMAGNGQLTVYVPGSRPDHVRSARDICDDRWHHLAMIYEPQRVRLYVDGEQVADQALEFQNGASQPGGFAIGQLVGREIGCRGLIDDVRLSRGVRQIRVPTEPLSRDDQTLELWKFDSADEIPVSAKPPTPPQTDPSHWGKAVVGFDWTEQDSVDGRWNQTDVGPFLAHTLFLPGLPPVKKGLTIRVGPEQQASICFDTGLLNWRAAWTGGFLKFQPARYGIISPPLIAGELVYAVGDAPGWRIAGQSAALRYHSLAQSGRRVVLSYDVGATRVRESPDFVVEDGFAAFVRTLEWDAPAADLELVPGRFSGTIRLQQRNGQHLALVERDGQVLALALTGPTSAGWRVDAEQTLSATIPATAAPRALRVWTAHFPASQLDAGLAWLAQVDARRSHELPVQPSAPLFPEPLVTRGVRADDAAPYVLDTLTLPFDNPYRALLFVTGHDFFRNGDLALCTVHGDVWTVSGVDDRLDKLTWRRYATGLFQPLGLKIVDDRVYVLGRDQITRLVDRNADGAADLYENFCNAYHSSPGGHDFIACLETDSQGRFHFVHALDGLLRVSLDGRQVEHLATGFRNPNGLGIGPGDVITVAPQEGEWTPASAIMEVRPGGHYGYGGPRVTATRPLGYDPPLCWIPRLQDNSCGGQVWAPPEGWGPLSGQLLHFSFGQCRMLQVLRETVDDVVQGATVTWPLLFESGVCRGRFSPHDGQLYVSGLKGWVTSAVQDGCLQRVRYTGRPACVPIRLQTRQNGFVIEFSAPLPRDAAEDPDNYRVQRWDYQYSAGYGSAEYRDAARGIIGREDIEVRSATVLPDGRSLFLETPDLHPAMQYALLGSIARPQGPAIPLEIYPTTHRVPALRMEDRLITRRARPGRLAEDLQQRLQPGLVLDFRQDSRADLAVGRLAAWHVAPDEAPALRLQPGPFRVTATGWLRAPARERYRWRMVGRGAARVLLDDQEVWRGDGVLDDVPAAERPLSSGYHRVAVEYVSPADGPASARLLWTGETFAEEPLPPTHLWHDPQTPGLADSLTWREGRWLWEELRCAACHGATARPQPTAPDLGVAARRIHSAYLQEWLLDPRSLRADAAMPQLLSTDAAGRQAAADLDAYLRSLPQPPAGDAAPAPIADAESPLWEDLGCIACHRWTPPAADDPFRRTSLHFTAAKFRGDGLEQFLKSPQQHHPAGRMPDFRLDDAEIRELAGWIRRLSTGALAAANPQPPGNAQRGRELFQERRCAACHSIVARDKEPAAPPWPAVPLRTSGRGCLADVAADRAAAPDFALTPEQRAALRTFVDAAPADSAAAPAPVERAERLLARYNCRACHHRDQQLSPRGEIIAEESERGLPPEALPNLTWTGDKLRPEWLEAFLAGRVAERPRTWLKARMPAFPAVAADIARGLSAGHGLGVTVEPSPVADAVQAEVGRRLMQTQGGLDCRQCHALAGAPPVGDAQTQIARGVDLRLARDRLRGEFYRRLVLDPPRFDVGTRMPKLAPDGRTTKLTQVYDGDASRQFEAIWRFLQTLPAETPAE